MIIQGKLPEFNDTSYSQEERLDAVHLAKIHKSQIDSLIADRKQANENTKTQLQQKCRHQKEIEQMNIDNRIAKVTVEKTTIIL